MVSTSHVKGALRSLLRPVANGLYRLGPAPARLERTQAELAEVRDQLPVVWNTLASQNALAREWMRSRVQLTEELAELRTQIEELRAQRAAAGHRSDEVKEPVVVNPARLAAFDGDLRLNLLAGGEPLSDFVNVGAAPGPGIDVVADARCLPAPAGSVSHLRCDRLPERLCIEDLDRSLLAYWRSLLRPSGRLTVIVSDAEAMIDAVEAGRMSFGQLREALCAASQPGVELGRRVCSARLVGRLLEDAGFEDVRVERCSSPSGPPYQMAVQASRPPLAEERPTRERLDPLIS